MIGIFVFKAKPEDKDYKYKKEPKQPLKLTDEELVHFVRTTPKMTYFCHYTDKYDKVSDEDKVKAVEKHWDNDYSTLKKIRGCENSYQTEDGKHFIKVITREKEWFSKNFC